MFVFWKNSRLDNLFLKLSDLYKQNCIREFKFYVRITVFTKSVKKDLKKNGFKTGVKKSKQISKQDCKQNRKQNGKQKI